MRRVLWLCILVVILGITNSTHAQSIEEYATWSGTIQGVPTWITVIPREHEITAETRRTKNWWEWGNTSSDTYIFAFRDRDNPRIILSFDQDTDGSLVAKIFLNKRGKEKIEYLIRDGNIQVHTSDGFPYATLRSSSGGWTDNDGMINYNLSMAVDGPTPGFGYELALTDGVIDTIHTIGSNNPGIPDWQTSRVINDLYPTWAWGYLRFGATKRLPDAPPFKVAVPLMPNFPYFDLLRSSSTQGKTVQWFTENPQPLSFNLDNNLFETFGFPGSNNGGMFYVSSISPSPAVDFESPSVFYSFGADTRMARLVVRSERWPAGDIYGPASNLSERTTFRYSWKTTDDRLWRYSLGFSGFHAFEDQYQIGNETVTIVGPDQLPDWILSRSWPVTTFTEAVDGFPGAEGIYAYSAQSNHNRPWLDGVSTEPPAYLWAPYVNSPIFPFESLPVGFRGEYITPNNDLPQLYFSPVDGRLHLLGAMGGIWNLGGGRILQLHNLDGDDHIDGWTREMIPQQSGNAVPLQSGSADLTELQRALPGEIEEALYTIEDYLAYSGSGRVIIAQPSYGIESPRISPPSDRESWDSFRMSPILNQQLERDPMDLVSWLGAFKSRKMSIEGAQITDVRHITDGFRFVLDLQPGFQSTGSDLLDLSNIEPGRYLVTYDGRFAIQSLTPPNPSVTLNTTELTQYEAGGMTLRLHNDGLTDLPVTAIEIWATPESGSAMLVITHTLALLSQQSQDLLLSWTPPMAGEWTLMPILRSSENEVWELPSTRVSVQPTETSDPLTLLKASSTATMQGFILVGWLGLTILAAFTFASQWSRRVLEQCDDPD